MGRVTSTPWWIVVAMYPGFYFYHWLGKKYGMPMVLGGYANVVGVLVILLMVANVCKDVMRGARFDLQYLDAFYILFMLYYSSIVLYNYVRVGSSGVGVMHFASILQSFSAYVCFRFLNIDDWRIKGALIVSGLLISVSVYFDYLEDGLQWLFEISEDSHAATYQGYARAFLVVICCALLYVGSGPVRVAYYLNAFFVLFLLGARSEVGVFVLFVVVYELVISKRPIVWLISAALLSVPFIGFISANVGYLEVIFPENRMLSLYDFGSDGSVVERSMFFNTALHTIYDNPFFGSYGSYVDIGGEGSYAHNLLSAWVDLGLPGFLMMIFLVGVSGYCALVLLGVARGAINEKNIKKSALVLSYWVMSVGLIVTAKIFSDSAFVISVAMISFLVSEKNSAQE